MSFLATAKARPTTQKKASLHLCLCRCKHPSTHARVHTCETRCIYLYMDTPLCMHACMHERMDVYIDLFLLFAFPMSSLALVPLSLLLLLRVLFAISIPLFSVLWLLCLLLLLFWFVFVLVSGGASSCHFYGSSSQGVRPATGILPRISAHGVVLGVCETWKLLKASQPQYKPRRVGVLLQGLLKAGAPQFWEYPPSIERP